MAQKIQPAPEVLLLHLKGSPHKVPSTVPWTDSFAYQVTTPSKSKQTFIRIFEVIYTYTTVQYVQFLRRKIDIL